MSYPEEFLEEIEEDVASSETGKTGCLLPDGDTIPDGSDEDSDDE